MRYLKSNRYPRKVSKLLDTPDILLENSLESITGPLAKIVFNKLGSLLVSYFSTKHAFNQETAISGGDSEKPE